MRVSSHRRYISAKHAADCFVYMLGALEGAKGIDYEKPIVDTTPRPESPATDHVDDLHELRHVFDAAKARLYPSHLSRPRRRWRAVCACIVLTTQHARWQAWCAVRIEGMSQRETASMLYSPRSTVRRWITHVDTLIEQELSDRRLMVRGRVDADGVEGEYHGVTSVRGPRQEARSVYVGVGE